MAIAVPYPYSNKVRPMRESCVRSSMCGTATAPLCKRGVWGDLREDDLPRLSIPLTPPLSKGDASGVARLGGAYFDGPHEGLNNEGYRLYRGIVT